MGRKNTGLRGRLMVGLQTLDLAILGSNPSPAAVYFYLTVRFTH